MNKELYLEPFTYYQDVMFERLIIALIKGEDK